MKAARWYESLIRPIALIAVIGVLSKLFQAVAAILVAHKLGAGVSTDAYLLAKSIPIGAYLIVDSLLYNSFVPMYRRQDASSRAAQRFLGALSYYCFALAILAAAGLAFAAPAVLRVLGPGSSPDTIRLATSLCRLMSLAVLGAIPASLLKSLNVCRGRYFLASLDAFVMHATMIAALLFAPIEWDIWPVAAALPAAFALLCALQVFAARNDLAPLRPARAAPHFAEMGGLIVPLVAVNAMQQLNALFMNGAASFVGKGAISCMIYSYNIAQIPVSMLDLILLSALFPFSARLAAQGDMRTFRTAYVTVNRLLVLILIPVGVWIALVRRDLVELVLQHGRFDAQAAEATSASLIGHALAVAPWALETFAYRSLFALKRHWRALHIIALRVVVNVLLCVVLVPRLGLLGVSMAFAFSYTVAAIAGAWAVSRALRDAGAGDGIHRRILPWKHAGAALLTAAGTACATILLSRGRQEALPMSTPLFLAISAAASGFFAAVAYSVWFGMLRRAARTEKPEARS
ncbi:MAG: oligosaccharide flippase family protein [Nitrospiraceae bacterium]|nr:oligosaccharide flippase family protein [Nitrospiraceae bacterium]